MRVSSTFRLLKYKFPIRTRNVFQTHYPHSTQVLNLPEEKLEHFRTRERNPIYHDELHLAKYYTMPMGLKEALFVNGGITTSHNNLITTFMECCLIVRPPFLEIKSYVEAYYHDLPALRIVLYGANGAGKTATLMHVLHYAFMKKYLLLHIPWVSNWTRRPKELVDSQSRPGRLDIPIESTLWLQHFKSQNLELLKTLDLKTSKSYIWSQREITEEGQPLLDVVDHGINRGVHASDCIAVLLKEIKLQSASGKFQTFVIIDGVNGFYSKTNLRMPDRTVAEATRLTLVRAFLKMLKNDWKNAVIVVSVDTVIANRNEVDTLPFTPRALLGKEGFELLDPFIPVEVFKFNDKEMETMLDYLIDRKWIQHEDARTEEGRTELKFLSGNSPFVLMKLCEPL